MRGRKRTYKLNECFFDPPLTKEAAYVMGFFLADGYFKVSMIKKKWPACGIGFGIHNKDVDHLYKLRDLLESEHPIRTRTMRGFIEYPISEITIHSKHLFDTLHEYWKIPRDKSHKARLPEIPENLLPFLICGFFDGDGYIGIYTHSKRHGKPYGQFGFCGGPIVLDIARCIQGATGICKEPTFRSRNSGSAYELSYCSREANALVWFCKGSENFQLSRKKLIVDQFINLFSIPDT